MAIRIKARHNEGVGQMLRRFKKLCEKEGLTKDVKRRQYFEKPSERNRRAQRKTVARATRTDLFGGGDSRGGGRGGAGGRSGPPGRSSGGRTGGGGGGGGSRR